MLLNNQFGANLTNQVSRSIDHADPIEPFEYWENSGRGRRLFRPILRGFQHGILPRALFSIDPILAEALSRPHPAAYDFLNLINRSALEYGRLKQWPADIYKQDALVDYVERFVLSVAAEQYQWQGVTVWIVNMPETVAAAEARVAVLWDCDLRRTINQTTARSRYFTLEQNSEGGYSLIERKSTGQRVNHGEMMLVEGIALIQQIDSRTVSTERADLST